MMDICDLIQALQLDDRNATKDEEMSDIIPLDKPEGTFLVERSLQGTESLQPVIDEEPTHGCAYIQALKAQIDAFQTTSGSYLEAIFTHREILYAYPPAHLECAIGFSEIANTLERRKWRADRDEDPQAVAAFRHEASTIAANTPISYTPSPSYQTVGCSMMPVF